MEALKGIGIFAIGIGAFIAIAIATVLFFSGVAYVSAIVIPWLFDAAWITFGISLVILFPLSFLRTTRVFSATGLVIGSYVFGLCGWVFAFLITYSSWGIIGVAVGLVFFGIGVMPIAIVASIIHGSWDFVWQLLTLIVLTFATRSYGFLVAGKADQDSYERNTITIASK
ncbi:MAG: hypothetical protein V4527_01785 [Pseudomonadota bacterium]